MLVTGYTRAIGPGASTPAEHARQAEQIQQFCSTRGLDLTGIVRSTVAVRFLDCAHLNAIFRSSSEGIVVTDPAAITGQFQSPRHLLWTLRNNKKQLFIVSTDTHVDPAADDWLEVLSTWFK